ncbi:BMP family ABC transporter substrate-binding protein [Breoghania sp.]|uniref:BMP family lipoprotein n=1 Tax=Breoghania sp. TaxID=2065378 RepID=UPI002620F761|nr:BMP family ABC transporter substrate-binding protein [Breoghania sp.]MDJ0933082.1 BMP family ABC transporter substrate-binding protein [Breoghania sp.]
MVTNQADLGDQGFNDLAKLGVETSAKELGGKPLVIQSANQSQFVPSLQQAIDQGSTVTTGVGFGIRDALTQVATSNPQARFTLIDALALDKDKKPLANVASVTFREHEAAFLTGIVAAMTTEGTRVDFIGGMETPPVIRFLSGFEASLHYVNPDIEISIAYVGSFTEPAKAKQLALSIYDLDADLIMDVAGGGGRGIFDAAKSMGKDYWVIGVDTCKGQFAPDNFLTSAVKEVAGAVVLENTKAAEGTFEGGTISLGLKEKAVGLCPDNIDTLSAEIMAKVETATAAILDGSIVVPSNEEDAKAFKVTAQ